MSGSLLRRAFEELDARCVSWCLLRDEDGLAVRGDVDILVSRADQARLASVLLAMSFVEIPAAGRGTHRFFIAYDPAEDRWLELDVVAELAYGPGYALALDGEATACLARRSRDGDAWALDPADAWWTLLLHVALDRDVVEDRHLAKLRALEGEMAGPGPLGIRVAGSAEAARSIMLRAPRGSADEWHELRRELSALLGRDAPGRVRRRRWHARAGRIVEPFLQVVTRPGVTVALLGPDGSGKSTLASGLTSRSWLPGRTVYLGLWGGPPPRNHAGVLARIALRPLWIWRRWAGAQFHRALGRLVIFDRYTYDAALPIRGRFGRAKGAYFWLLAHSIPSPDLVVVLDAPAEIVFSRKGESTPAELHRDRERLLEVAAGLRSSIVVDAARPPDVVRVEVTAGIWNQFAGRLRRRRRLVRSIGSEGGRWARDLAAGSRRRHPDAATVDRARRVVAGSGGPAGPGAGVRWQVDRVGLTETGTAIVRLGSPLDGGAILKFPAVTAGTGSIARHTQALRSLAGLDLGGFATVLPAILETGEIDGDPFVIERLMSGRPGTAFGRDAVPAVAASAAACVTELHRATSRPLLVDDDVLRAWIDLPASRLAAVLPSGRGLEHAVGAFARRAAKRLHGREVPVGWIHGDLWAGNVLAATPSGPITGIIDWDLAEADQPSLHDLLHLLLMNRRLQSGLDLGVLVRDLLEGGSWSAREREVLTRDESGLLREPRDAAIAVLLAWLRHVAALAPQPRHGDNPQWVRANVEVVLRCL
jgi:thymidylate kinase